MVEVLVSPVPQLSKLEGRGLLTGTRTPADGGGGSLGFGPVERPSAWSPPRRGGLTGSLLLWQDRQVLGQEGLRQACSPVCQLPPSFLRVRVEGSPLGSSEVWGPCLL